MSNLGEEHAMLRSANSALQGRVTTLEAQLREQESANAALRAREQRAEYIKRVLLAIRNVNQVIVQESDPQRLIERVCVSLTETLGYFGAWIALLDAQGETVRLSCASGFDDGFDELRARLARGEFPACMAKVLARGGPVVIADQQTTCGDCPLTPGYAGRAALARTLTFGDKVYGVLAVSVPASYALDEEEHAIFHEATRDLAFGLHKIEMEAQRRSMEREQAHLLHSMINAFAIFRSVYDDQGRSVSFRFEYINAAYERITGVKLEEVRGKTVHEVWPGTEPSWVENYGAVATSGVSRTFEMYHQPTNKLYHCTVYRPWDTSQRFCVVFEDITERKRAEDALRESEERFRAVVESAPEAIFIQTRKRLAYLNPAAVALFGAANAEQLLGGLVVDRIHPEDRAAVQERIEQVNEERRPAPQALKRILRCDGGVADVEALAVPFTYQGQNGALAFIRDITARKRAEEQLRVSEAFIKAVMDNLPLGVAVNSVDPTVKFDYMNDNFARLYRTSREALADPDSFWSAVYEDPDFRERIKKRVLDDCASGDSGRMHWEDLPITRKGAETTYVSARNTPVPGKPLMISTVWDVTERKRAEEALRESEVKFRLLFEAAPTGIALVDVQGVVQEANPTLLKLLGVSREELVGKSFVDLTAGYGLDSQQQLADFTERLTGGTPTNELTFLHRDGKPATIAVQSSPIIAAGQVVSILYLVSDITERKRAEDALRESEARFRSVVETAPEAIYVSSEGRFVYLNPGMFRLLGASTPEELLGTEVMARIAPEYHEAVRARIRLQRETGKPVPLMDQEYLRLDRSRVPVESTAVTILFEGRDSHLVFVRDVTQRKRAEQEREKLQAQLSQAQKMESIGRLAGGVAHDFNNMLSVIQGNADLALLELLPTHPLYEDLQQIRKAAQRSADLTRQLLAFARKQTVAPEVLDLNETVAGMVKMLQRLIGEDIDLAWRPGTTWTVKMDPSQIDQILANLCVNARDAIAGVGKVTIKTGDVTVDEAYCAAHVGFVPGHYVLLAVSDDGSGMTEEVKEHIFEPFFTTKGEGQGTGLGLATVYGAVKQNGGLINVYSEAGHGTTFRIYLPRHTGEAAASQPRGSVEAIPRGHETVLLVEDEAAILQMGTAMLERLGYRVLAARTPDEALRLAEEHTNEVDLLMTDVIMPGMNGRDLAARLSALDPSLRRLFMSGYTADVIAHHGVLENGMHFVQKPFSMRTLAAKVREALDGAPG